MTSSWPLDRLTSPYGLGGAAFGNMGASTSQDDVDATVDAALRLGITYIDTAPYYGKGVSEERLGRAIDGRRDEVILGTKCGRYGDTEFDYRPERLRRSVDESLERLRTERLDVLLLHDIDAVEPAAVHIAIEELHSFKQAGLTTSIGVSCYSVDRLVGAVETESLDVVMSFCNHNVLSRRLAPNIARLRAAGTNIVNASVLHMGGLLATGSADPSHPANDEVRAAAERFAALAREHGDDPAALATRFAVHLGGVDLTLIGAATPEQLRSSIALDADSPLDPALIERIDDTTRAVHDHQLFGSDHPTTINQHHRLSADTTFKGEHQ